MKPNVLAFYRPTSGVSYHRIERPLRRLNELGLINLTLLNGSDPLGKIDLPSYTHVISSRFIPVRAEAIEIFANLCKSRGVRVIVDQDDWWHLPAEHDGWKKYEQSIHLTAPDGSVKGVRGIRWLIERSMKIADEVWVTHNYLAKKVHQFNKNTVVIPNAIHPEDPQWQHTRQPSEHLRFGYIGGVSHRKDLQRSGIDLSEVNGYCVNIENYAENTKAPNILQKKIVHNYGELYQQIDVSLAPLIPSEFARCKSNLKMLEAGFSGCAIIVQNVAPYTSIARPGVNCIGVDWSNNDWMKEIRNLHKDRALELAAQLAIDVQPYQMDKVNQIRQHALLK